MSELNNCGGTTCDKQKLADEINALKAQVENFRNHLKALTRRQNHVGQSERASALEAMKAIPAQCLAEIRAQAVEDARHSCEKRLLAVVDSHTGEQDFITCCESNDLTEYASRLRVVTYE